MSRTALSILLMSTFVPGIIRAQHTHTAPMVTLRQPLISLGVKAGFNSSMFFTDELSIDGQGLEGIQNNYKVGYFAAVFCRFNLKRHHFIQPELSYNVSKGSLSINDPLENSSLMPDDGLIKMTVTSIDIPLMYGYKFIDSRPYGMSLIVGPKIAWNWKKHTKNEYAGFFQQSIRENYRPFNYSAVAGVAVNISNIFFDFRYEIDLNNILTSVSYDREATEVPYNTCELVFRQRRNVMSFSLGVIF